MRRLLPAALGLAFGLIPFFPAFITLTGVTVPGVSLVPVPVAKALLGLAAAVALYGVVMLARVRGEPAPTVTAFAAFPIAALAAALLGFDPLAGALFLVILIFGVIWHALILRFHRDPRVASTIAVSFLVSGALAGLAAIAMALARVPPALYTVGHGRAIGTFILPGELAGYLILYVPFAYALARTAPQRATRRLAYACLIAGSAAFVLTFSRAGWVGMAAAIAFYAGMQRRRERVRFAVAIVGLAIVALGVVFNTHHDPSENFTRLSIWQAAAQMIARFPLTGVGPFDFAALYPLLRAPDGEPIAFHAHGFLLTVAAELGLGGVAAVCFGWCRFALVFARRVRDADEPPLVAFAIAAGLVGTWVQSTIDTVSLVVFALWPAFTALALASIPAAARDDAAVRPTAARPARRAAYAIAGAIGLGACAFVQLASDAVYAHAGSAISFPHRLAPPLGIAMYRLLERVAPLPFVEAELAEAALREGDAGAAAAHAARLPAGSRRSETLARIALARGHEAEAVPLFLAAGDDVALQAAVDRLAARGRARDAYLLERRILERLAASPIRPNAVADSWWRLGRLAARLGVPDEARADFARAGELAPLNTKYLLDAGVLALERRDAAAAWDLFERAVQIDPASADAVAGMGLASLRRGDVAESRRLSALAQKLNARAGLPRRLKRALETGERVPLSGVWLLFDGGYSVVVMDEQKSVQELVNDVRARVERRTFAQDVSDPLTGQIDRRKIAAKFNNLEHAVDELAEAVERTVEKTA